MLERNLDVRYIGIRGKHSTAMPRRDALLVLDLGLDILDGVRGLDLEGDGLAREGLDENLHIGRIFARPFVSKQRPEKEDVYGILHQFCRLPYGSKKTIFIWKLSAFISQKSCT